MEMISFDTYFYGDRVEEIRKLLNVEDIEERTKEVKIGDKKFKLEHFNRYVDFYNDNSTNIGYVIYTNDTEEFIKAVCLEYDVTSDGNYTDSSMEDYNFSFENNEWREEYREIDDYDYNDDEYSEEEDDEFSEDDEEILIR